MKYVKDGYTYELGADGYYYLTSHQTRATSIGYTEQDLINAGFTRT